MTQIAPYGSWSSPITSECLVSRSVRLSHPEISGMDIFWLEQRPEEGGRQVLLRKSELAGIEELLPAPWNVRTRVHEYGGGAYCVHKGVVYFSNDQDQRLYRLKPGKQPAALTPDSGSKLRYADLFVDAQRGLLFCVREDHRGVGETRSEPDNNIVAIDLKGGEDEGRVIVSGRSFYSNPRLSPNDMQISWLCWNHPNMPWIGTELWLADLDEFGSIFNPRMIAGGSDEAIFQPTWSPDGDLFYISDRTMYWNIYRYKDGREESLYPVDAEFGEPAWAFGLSTYGFESTGRIACTYRHGGRSHLALLDTHTLKLSPFETDCTEITDLHAANGEAVFLGGSPSSPQSLYWWSLKERKVGLVRVSSENPVDPGVIPVPSMINFPTKDGHTAHAVFYPPTNADFSPPPDEKPPLIVRAHGGPTSRAKTSYRTDIFYFTSRGFAVVDVDYGGSTGYGRSYRQRLDGNWGIVDVDDCTRAALYLADQGLVDRDRMAISGGSAGGFTVLTALVNSGIFKAGASYYGVADLEALARFTHKFEARYLDGLVGPYPARRDLYLQRSPINHVDQLSCALIILQGLEDPVVPPAQSEMMYRALLKKGLPVAYLTFEGEQHGFRKAENIKRAAEAELYFYSRIFGFRLADAIKPVKIKNLGEKTQTHPRKAAGASA